MSKKKSVKNDTLANDRGRKAASCWLYLLCLQRGYNTNAINVIFFPSGWFILQMHDRTMPFLVTDLKKKREWEKAGSKSNFAYCFHVFCAFPLNDGEDVSNWIHICKYFWHCCIVLEKNTNKHLWNWSWWLLSEQSLRLWVECPLLWIFRSLEIHNLEEKRRRYGGGLKVG